MPQGDPLVPACIRIPRGFKARVREATGMEFSTFMRLLAQKTVRQLEAAAAKPQEAVDAAMEEAVKEVLP